MINLKSFIKKCIYKEWKFENRILFLVILIFFSLITFYNLKIGLRMSSDSHTFSRWADNLINLNFNFYQYYIQNTFGNPNFIYTVPILLMSITKLIFGSEWQYSFMIINLILVLFSFIIFTKILILLKVRPLIICLSMPLLTLSSDFLTWPRYILTDTIFAFIVILTIYFTVRKIVQFKQSYFPLIIMIVLLIFSRPSSIPYVFTIICFMLIMKSKIKFNPKIIITTIFLLLIITPFIFSFFYLFMKNNLNNIPQVLYLINWVESGQVIHDRPSTWTHSPNTFFDLVYLYFMRILFFFNPYFQSFSNIHNLLNLFQSIIIFFSILFWIFSKEKSNTFNQTIALILLFAFFVAAFHSYTIIDYDWRYRYPLILPLLVIFPISLEILFRKITNSSKLNFLT
jgi:hypothetical protein